ncbi:hypothetical protein J1605_015922 [Eschrichtius robustus]|uniref:Uncharacterized protein n=1 Tax=Eschrichtius robustus TaxID=9764 RepID=A0AB34G9W8_ESCRO|nr:hypothetical protein J1605_015922 [Eschrichtius robustus]
MREDEEQEPPPLLPPPGTGEEPGPGGGDRAPWGESLLGLGLPPPAALTSGPGIEAGGCFPGGAEPGNGLKPHKRPRENKEVPRASLLSFQDEDEENEEVFKEKFQMQLLYMLQGKSVRWPGNWEISLLMIVSLVKAALLEKMRMMPVMMKMMMRNAV